VIGLAVAEFTIDDDITLDIAPRYLLRDRDSIYGNTFCGQFSSMEIKEVLMAPLSP
jgi:hypothetical protein